MSAVSMFSAASLSSRHSRRTSYRRRDRSPIIHSEDSDLSDLQVALLAYTEKVLDTTIDRGECWDFVAAAMDDADAKWERPKEFGEEIDWKSDGIQDGDIILYEKAQLAAPDFSSSAYFNKHYAMVYEVIEGLKFTMAHQNYDDNKTVHFSEIDFNYLQSGKITVWRPAQR